MKIPSSKNLTIKELQTFMNFHGVSKKEFSEILGVSIQAVNLWMNGKREFSITNSKLIKIFIKYPQLIREF